MRKPKTKDDAEQAAKYAAYKESQNEIGLTRSRAGRNIGTIPPPVNAARKNRCRKNLEKFCTAYFPEAFTSPFSDAHKRLIKTAERTILKGGKFVEAVFRGFGKSTIAEVTVIWAACYGHKNFVPLIGSSADAAAKSIGSIKSELEKNDLLAEDFPEVCLPIRALEGITLRTHGQTYTTQDNAVENTRMQWTADEIVLPAIKGSPAAGAIIVVYGIESRKARGLRFKRPDGKQVRPDFVFIDDPQTDEVARNPAQVSKVLNTINKAILMSAGHAKKMSALVACTVIEPDDVADRLLDHARNPSWIGHRVPMMESMATAHDTLWMTDYADIRKSYTPGDIADKDRAEKQATEFYKERRDEMDAGAIATWKHCYSRDCEISAVQHAYNILIDMGADVFASECQNAPLLREDDPDQITHSALISRVKNQSRFLVPAGFSSVVAAMDVHDNAIYYCVLAVRHDDFSSHVLDYGMIPEQPSRLFGHETLTKILLDQYPGLGREAAMRAGIIVLVDKISRRGYPCEDGSEIRVSKILVDSGYEQDLVFETIADIGNPLVSPSKGFGIRVTSKPFLERARDKGAREIIGTNGTTYREKNCATHKQLRIVQYDANAAKTFLKNRLFAALGSPGAMSIFMGSPQEHEVFFQHLVSETAIPTEGNGRQVTEWKNVMKHDNHWLDCLAYCCVAASVTGARVEGQDGKILGRRKRTRVAGSRGSFAERQRAKREGR
jgi:hypothetical protein